MDTLIAVPLELCEPFQIQELLDFTANILKRGNIELQAAALRFLEYGASFKGMLDGFHRQILAMLESLEIGKVPLGFHYNLRNIYQALGADSLSAAFHMSEEEEQKAVSELFLENLKAVSYTHLDVYKRQLLAIGYVSSGSFQPNKVFRSGEVV